MDKENNKSIYIWLDILGFSEALEKSENYNKLSELLTKFQALFIESHKYQADIISDGIILTIERSEHLVAIIKEIGEKQFKFIIEHNVFIRGGIAVGIKNNSKNDNKKFISNGLSRAVKLEGQYISWPIIGTDEKNIKEIELILNSGINSIPHSPLSFKYIKIEDLELKRTFNALGDTIYFIDFIKKDMNYYHLLENKIKKYKEESYIQNKYIWLLRYYHDKYEQISINDSLNGVLL